MSDVQPALADPALFEPAARAAAGWWAEKLSGRVIQSNGDRTENGLFAMYAGTMLADKTSVNDEQAKVFVDELTRIVSVKLARFYRPGMCQSLGVDYGPDLELGEAADRAGIASARFPWKTNMWVYIDHVTVSAGYGAPAVLVWQADDWERPLCGQQRFHPDPDDFTMLPEKCGLPRYHEEEHGDFVPSPLCTAEGCGEPAHAYVHETDNTYPSSRAHPFQAPG